MIAGIQYFNQHAQPPDAVVLIRGGGSADDLATFSIEQVVRAVSASRIPTVVAIGHETDESLAELAADMRASTPSNAAELLFPDSADISRRLSLQRTVLAELVHARLEAKAAHIERERSVLSRAVENAIERKHEKLTHSSALLEAIHPKSTLRRGYALVQTAQGKLVSSTSQIMKGDDLDVSFSDGSVRVVVSKGPRKG